MVEAGIAAAAKVVDEGGLGRVKTPDSLDLRAWPPPPAETETAEPLPTLNTLSLDSDLATPVLPAGDGAACGKSKDS